MPTLKHGGVLGERRSKISEMLKDPRSYTYSGKLFNELRMSPEEQQNMIDELLKNLSTIQEQGLNRARESSVNLPEATLAARERGVTYQGALAGEKGIFDIEQFAKGVNRDAAKFELNYLLQKQIAEMNTPSTGEMILGFLGNAAQYAGYGLGAGLFGTATTAASGGLQPVGPFWDRMIG